MDPSLNVLNAQFFWSSAPILILAVGSIVLMLQQVFSPFDKPGMVFSSVNIWFGAAVCAAIFLPQPQLEHLGGAFLSDKLALFGQSLLIGLSWLIAGLFWGTDSNRRHFYRGEVSSLYMMTVTGLAVLVSSNDFVTLFVGLELAALGVYCLAGYLSPNRRSQEGAIKYFIIGSIGAAMFLFGVALLYAGSGTLNLKSLGEILPSLGESSLIKIGSFFTVVAVAIKLALAPFHLWAPDVYEGSPTGITAFMATCVKIAVMIFLIRFLNLDLTADHFGITWQAVLSAVAVVSLIAGNIMALVQSSVKRMLAYSSISHTGYLAVGAVSISSSVGIDAILFYLVSYSIMSLGIFGIIMSLENDNGMDLQLRDLRGLSSTHPIKALGVSVLMLGLAGMPPTVGFISKFYVFSSALEKGFYGLVLAGVVGTAISLYYYLGVIVKMYMDGGAETTKVVGLPSKSPAVLIGLAAVAVLMTVWFGIAPDPLLSHFQAGEFLENIATKGH